MEWLPTQEALDGKTNSPCKYQRKIERTEWRTSILNSDVRGNPNWPVSAVSMGNVNKHKEIFKDNKIAYPWGSAICSRCKIYLCLFTPNCA